MSYKYKIEEVAAAQLLEAAVWYEQKRIGLGDDLILCFEEGIETICRSPFGCLFSCEERSAKLEEVKFSNFTI